MLIAGGVVVVGAAVVGSATVAEEKKITNQALYASKWGLRIRFFPKFPYAHFFASI